MRIRTVAILTACISLQLFAQPAVRVEYGKALELRNVKRVYIGSTAGPELAAEASRQLSQMLPALSLAESEDLGDVTITLSRKMPAPDARPEAEIATTAVVARATSGRTVRLYLDATSQKKDLTEAVHEVLTAVVALLQEANPAQYGTPPGGTTRPGMGKPKIHTTAGLRPGLSRREVLLVLGPPTQVFKRAPSEVWIYKTTAGSTRLVFGGDFLTSVSEVDKK